MISIETLLVEYSYLDLTILGVSDYLSVDLAQLGEMFIIPEQLGRHIECLMFKMSLLLPWCQETPTEETRTQFVLILRVEIVLYPLDKVFILL